jgi:hypothetical protein
MAYKNLKIATNKRKYKRRYWVVLPHWTRGDLQPKIRKYKPDIFNTHVKCWKGYDWVAGSFKTLKEAREHVVRENDFRRSKGWLKEKGKPYKTIFQIGDEIKVLDTELKEKMLNKATIEEIMEIINKIVDLNIEYSKQWFS